MLLCSFLFIKSISICFIFLLLIVLDISSCNVLEDKNDCDFHVTVIRQLENDGFHREIHSLVELVGGYGVIQRQHCSLVLRETLPSGLYASPDQLEDLARLGQVQACAGSHVDIEAPEPFSSNLSVLVYSGLTREENLLSAQLVLPVHARYHEPSEDGGYRAVTVGPPQLFLRCAGAFHCPQTTEVHTLPCYACATEQCSWMEVPFKTNAENLYMLVPVGNMQHYYLVTIMTFMITTGGAIYILSIMANSAANVL